MIAQPNLDQALLTDDALYVMLHPLGRDYLALILLSADLPNAERRGAMRARRGAKEAYGYGG